MLTFLKEHSLFIAVPIILLGIFLRVYQLGHVPAVSHRDETSIGYNAYSLLKTGQDEHGEPWPLNFKCFGDYKLPGLIYSTIPFIRLFGLTHLAVRLPTAIFAVLTLASTYWLLKQLKFSKNTSLVFLVLLSLSFWHISQARNAYEPMAGLFWTVLSWTAWLKAPENQKFYLVSLLSYGLGIFFYNQPLILLPLLFIGSTFLDREKYFRNSKGIVIASLFLLLQ